jgi:hypothetical protein
VPLTWIIAAGLTLYYFGWQYALLSIPAMILCGYVALKTFEELIDLSVWWRASWLLVRERGLFLRLLIRRQNLQKEIETMLDETR